MSWEDYAGLSRSLWPGPYPHAGAEPFVRFGELDNRAVPAERLRQAFVRASVQVDIPSDIHVALWMKLLFITPWSGIGAGRAPVEVA